MMLRWSILAMLALGGCGRAAEHAGRATKQEQPSVPAPGTGPDAKTPLAPIRRNLPEPKGPIDPKSVQAAGQVVQQYGALIGQGQWTASRDLWSNAESAKEFERSFRGDADVHLEIGELGETEGAAGSIYVTEPVTFYGKTNKGSDYRRAAVVTLRRVNDVPGSTEVQRRWHIERIEWKDGA